MGTVKKFFQRHQFVLLFLITLLFCNVMVLRQYIANQSKHVALREAFIYWQEKGVLPEAERCYERLVFDLKALPTKALVDDIQRTVPLVSTSTDEPENLTWKYYWTVRNELARRTGPSQSGTLVAIGKRI